MPEFFGSISTHSYKFYSQIMIYNSSFTLTNYPIKLEFNDSNFNFSSSLLDGNDIKACLSSNGTGCLYSWIERWDNTNNVGSIWIRIPYLEANKSLKLHIFWGNLDSEDNNSIANMNFNLSDDFRSPSTTLDLLKWNSNPFIDFTSGIGAWIQANTYLTSISSPLSLLKSWEINIGCYVDDTSTVNNTQTLNLYLAGSNNLYINQFSNLSTDNHRISHTLINSSTVTAISDGATEKGLSLPAYNKVCLKYYEPLDRMYYGLYDRVDVSDYSINVERNIEGETTFSDIRLANNSYSPRCYISWIYIKEYKHLYEPTIDFGALKNTIETVNVQQIPSIEYDDDFTNINTYIISSIEDIDNTKLIDNNSYNSIWDTGSLTTVSGYILIDTKISSSNLLTDDLVYYDKGHEGFLNASMIINESSYFRSRYTSCWIGVQFNELTTVNVVKIKGVSSYLSGLPNYIKIYGTNTFPYYSVVSDWILIHENDVSMEDSWQIFYFNNSLKFKYYILYFPDTFGDKVTLDKVEMFYGDNDINKVCELVRIKPYNTDGNYIYFPKQMSLSGSNNMITWDTLLDYTNTYTPTDGKWQEYIISNVTSYSTYKIYFIGNWNNNNGGFKIAEIELKESLNRSRSYYILDGISDNFSSIVASEYCGLDSGVFYATNDYINVITDSKLTNSTSIDVVSDILII